MMSVAYLVFILFGMVLIFMGFQGVHTSWNRVVPISYRITYVALYTCYTVCSIYLARMSNDLSTIQTIAVALMLALIIGNMILMLGCVINRNYTVRKISFKNTLLYGFRSKEEQVYQKFDVEKFAKENNLGYIANITGNRIENDSNIERIIAKDNKYIKFYPFNDGYAYSPKKEWYGKFEKNGSEYYAKIMDTKTAFNCISNLKEIIMHIIQIYEDNIYNDVFIDPYEFVLELEGEPVEGYIGPAKLLITSDTIKNSKIEIDEMEKARKYYINRFLNCFIGWNFGLVVEENEDLQKKLRTFNEFVIVKGLRTQRQPGNKLYFDDYIKRYKLNTENEEF